MTMSFGQYIDNVEQTLQMPDNSQDENGDNNNDGEGEDDDSNGSINPGNSDKKMAKKIKIREHLTKKILTTNGKI